MDSKDPLTQFSRKVKVSDIGESGLSLVILANQTECKSLARRLNILELRCLEADIKVVRRDNEEGTVDLTGQLRAKLVQNCIISLVPVESSIFENFSAVFKSLVPCLRVQDSFKVDDSDTPEFYSGGILEIGSTVLEYLSLSLDPYPRHPDAIRPENINLNVQSEDRENTYKPLKNLKSLLKNKNS